MSYISFNSPSSDSLKEVRTSNLRFSAFSFFPLAFIKSRFKLSGGSKKTAGTPEC